MDFEKHLFISYAHIDNLPLSPEQKGWISRFHDSLDAMLSMRIGRKAVIWRDSKLAGNDVFGDEIIAQFPRTAVLLSIISPRYVESEWCTREVDEFCKAAQRSIGLSIDNKSRIVKIIKSPVDRDDPLPAVMRAVLGYQFYDLDEDNTPLEFDPVYGAEMAQKYHVKVAKLAWEISEVLKDLAKANLAKPKEEQPWAPTVYLAECSFDQRDVREALEAELKCHGYRVLPDRQLSRNESKYIEQVTALLAQCQLSVHLVGSTYGAVPDGPTEKSIIVLQNELATQLSRKRGLRRVIWLPEGTTPKQQEQRDFVLQLQTDATAQFGADLITSSEPGQIKAAIHAIVGELKTPPVIASAPEARNGRPLVYLICDQKDRPDSIGLRKYLIGRGFQVEIPVFEGDAATVRKDNQEMLQRCDGVLIFYGNGGEAWKRSVGSEVRKYRRVRGDGVPFPVYTYLAGPETEAKRDLIELEESQVINCLPGFSEAAVSPFLLELERRP